MLAPWMILAAALREAIPARPELDRRDRDTQPAADRDVSGFMRRGDLQTLRHELGLILALSKTLAPDRFQDVRLRDRRPPARPRQRASRRLTDHALDLGGRPARRLVGRLFEIECLGRPGCQEVPEQLQPVAPTGQRAPDLDVAQPAGPQDRRVQAGPAVGGRDHHRAKPWIVFATEGVQALERCVQHPLGFRVRVAAVGRERVDLRQQDH